MLPPADPATGQLPPMFSVELVCQQPAYTLQRSQHRVPAGTTIRQFLLAQPQGSALVAAIDARQLGLARFGRRAWLDDPVQPDDRIEILQPLVADAKAARFARVAQARAAKGRAGKAKGTSRRAMPG